MSRASWKVIATLLADRLAEQLGEGCPSHGKSWQPHWHECPHCADARAYQAYLNAGGYDFRPVFKGTTVTLQELITAAEEDR